MPEFDAAVEAREVSITGCTCGQYPDDLCSAEQARQATQEAAHVGSGLAREAAYRDGYAAGQADGRQAVWCEAAEIVDDIGILGLHPNDPECALCQVRVKIAAALAALCDGPRGGA